MSFAVRLPDVVAATYQGQNVGNIQYYSTSASVPLVPQLHWLSIIPNPFMSEGTAITFQEIPRPALESLDPCQRHMPLYEGPCKRPVLHTPNNSSGERTKSKMTFEYIQTAFKHPKHTAEGGPKPLSVLRASAGAAQLAAKRNVASSMTIMHPTCSPPRVRPETSTATTTRTRHTTLLARRRPGVLHLPLWFCAAGRHGGCNIRCNIHVGHVCLCCSPDRPVCRCERESGNRGSCSSI
jgi:hypothetical protein